MKKNYLLLVIMVTGVLVFSGCGQSAGKSKLLGKWYSPDKKTSLKITGKDFTLDEGDGPVAESYFVKGDTVFTSYEGSQPFTKFVIKDLSDKSLTLVYPDSTSVKFIR